MEKKFKIGQRVKILEHKGTCFENATGTVVVSENIFSKIKLDKNKNIQKEFEFWLPNCYLEAIEDEPTMEQKVIKAVNNLQEAFNQYISTVTELCNAFEEEVKERNIEIKKLNKRWNKLKEFVNQKLESGTPAEFYDYQEMMCEINELEKQQQDGGEDE